MFNFGYNNVILDIEGLKDIEVFVKLAQRLASDVGEIVTPKRITRIGMRQISLLSAPPSARPLADVIEAFGPKRSLWDSHGTRDQVSDIGTIVNFNSERFDGMVQFGPYVQGVNNVQNFIYSDHPDLKSFRNGYIFNCDYGEKDMDSRILAEDTLAEWMRSASTISRERIEKIRRYIYPSESLESQEE